ncbi:glycosyltransferase involved in cell wall biosynthesis [Paenibacillus cellulosilyticus]|uniref:Glycosyltransferase involved in cell wall biosynthesis n=1 Tax=Paenibacillus cellulosilyticus TaxID=375489 RepID=A0A2V2YVC4_9BACL|nr:glycosyltransferase [Paenibacillus cellulosilyticus]PWV94385.1 glycosyltransferase involved in cell wall biosynthesis [Paenibacillus cellulosilyticus]QKS43888.1 glycosyltransferase [Paenibacillus cellulosilyticus]
MNRSALFGGKFSSSVSRGVTIVTSTIRPKYMKLLLENYARQQWAHKELIIVLNRERMSMSRYEEAAQKYDNVRILRLPSKHPLGDCLNLAASHAQYPYIAKFDDDDYYGPGYIADSMNTFAQTGADIVGKRSFFFYFPHRQLLMLRMRKDPTQGDIKRVAGATLMFRASVLEHVKFGKKKQGSDVQFLRDCLQHGLMLRSASPYHFAAFRRADQNTHTWKVQEKELLADKKAQLIYTDDFKQHVDHLNVSPNELPPGKAKSRTVIR